ncbi:MAG TPA: M28 family peptidase [Candidatus Binatia bacterium]|nr:M28 family peptidase [Candidatus Binatia bacterium]
MSVDVDRDRLASNLQKIIGERSPFSGRQRLAAVEGFIQQEFAACGLTVESDVFRYREEAFHNILGRYGAEGKRPIIILGAHFDSVAGTPGADDNASGVAVLLEAARIIVRQKIASPVLFCGFNLEELNMIGSTALARKLHAAGAKIQAMISLEMIGYIDSTPRSQKLPVGLGGLYPDRGDFIGVIGNWKSNWLLRRFSGSMREVRDLNVQTLSVPGKGMLIPAVRLSDHSPFWDLGFPALMITDTAFYRNPNYHRPTDTFETLNLEFMAKVCEGVVRGVSGIESGPAG